MKFDHPPKGKKWVIGTRSAIKAYYEFTATAEFIPESEDPRCACECCEFRQFVLRSNCGIGGEPPKAAPVREDCIYIVKRPNGKRERVRAIPGVVPPGKAGVDWWGPYCGGHRQKQGPEDPFDPPSYYPGDGCELAWWDRPSCPLPIPCSWHWDTSFLGIIYDTCQDWAIREARAFGVAAEGTVDAAGEGHLAGTPQFTPHPPYSSSSGG